MEIRQLRIGGLLLPSNVLMAPLAGYTCYPFRLLAYQMGAGLCFTEMVSANALKYKDRATSRLLFSTDDEPIKAVQLLGGSPAVMEQMAKSPLLEPFDLIDINMGCPVPNVFKSGEGSALMLDMPRASAVIRACKKSGKPVSVKCRTGIREDEMFAAEFARMCEASGADMITIHGRSRSMMYDGTPHYDQIAQAKAAVSIPVIANGGIFSPDDADEMMAKTGADGVMIARYALENPFIFRELTNPSSSSARLTPHTAATPTTCPPPRPLRISRKTTLEILLEQLELTSTYYDETFTLTYMRKLASYGMKKRRGTKKYKERLYQCGSIDELRELLTLIFRDTAMIDTTL